METEALVSRAWEARERAYAPYSHFMVGAALEDEDGRVFTGVNVENLSFGLTICAERAAVFAAVVAGSRRFRTIAIVSDSREAISPCGACRLVLAEFSADLTVISRNKEGETFQAQLTELLPRAKAGILDAPEIPPCST